MAHAQYDRRKLAVKLSVALAAAAMVLSTAPAHADLGEQLAKLLARGGWHEQRFTGGDAQC